METRICNQCKIEKPVDDFGKSSLKYSGGYQYKCKECCREWRKNYYVGENLEKERERNKIKQREAYRSNPQRERDTKKKSYYKNQDKEIIRIAIRRAEIVVVLN